MPRSGDPTAAHPVEPFAADRGGAAPVPVAIALAAAFLVAALAVDSQRPTPRTPIRAYLVQAGLLVAEPPRRAVPPVRITAAPPPATVVPSRPAPPPRIEATARDLARRSDVPPLPAPPPAVPLSLELAIVVDTSAATAGAPLDAMRAGAAHLIARLADRTPGRGGKADDLRFGVVPYAGSVNVGTDFAGAAWITGSPVSPAYWGGLYSASEASLIPVRSDRFALYRQLGQSWRGCVEARPAPYDTTDAPPDASRPETLFAPTFAPDEPDAANADGETYTNSYLADDGGSCRPAARTCAEWTGPDTCRRWEIAAIAPKVAQARLCKYNLGGEAKPALAAAAPGPHANCDASPVTPLTADRAVLAAALARLQAAGSSSIAEGVMWGWRLLSPTAPFAGGRRYGEPLLRKAIVVLAAAPNDLAARANANGSDYGAWGYAGGDRLASSRTGLTAPTAAMDDKTRAACRNAAARGIAVYTVAYGGNDQTAALLQACATQSAMAFTAATPSVLTSVLDRIAADLTTTRLAEGR